MGRLDLPQDRLKRVAEQRKRVHDDPNRGQALPLR